MGYGFGRWIGLAVMAGCAAEVPPAGEIVSAEDRLATADELRNARGSFNDFLLDLARWYREIYTPPLDFDGDGYADMAAGVAGFPNEQVQVFYGGPAGLSAVPDAVLPSPSPTLVLAFAESAGAGDVNGDGYTDLVVGANNGNTAGQAFVYLGGPAGLATTPAQTLNGLDTGVPTLAFGYQVAAARDVDLDGYDDVLVSAVASPTQALQNGVAFVYRGGPGGLETLPTWTLYGTGGTRDNFGSSMISTHLNFDCWPDLVIGEARNILFGGNSTGRVHVFLGGPTGYASTADQVLLGPSGPLNSFGLQVTNVGDINLDGHGDFAVGEPLVNGFTGTAWVYLGTDTGVDEVPGLQLDPPAGSAGGFFGWSQAGGGDADRDGFADIAVGETDASNYEGRAHVYFGPFWVWPGSASNPVVVTPDQTLAGTHTGEAYFGQEMSFVGDLDGNRSDELIVGAPWADVRGRVYTFEGTTPGAVGAAPKQTFASTLTTGRFGLSLAR
ncbi:MAG: VCBS repeat-containing protein [Myxococcota bacterium]